MKLVEENHSAWRRNFYHHKEFQEQHITQTVHQPAVVRNLKDFVICTTLALLRV